jgi:LPS-assembly protein
MVLTADEIDYNEESGDAEARGHVRYERFSDGQIILCDKAEYNLNDEKGKFYQISGTSPAKIEARPGLLTTHNAFYFQGEHAEREKDRYLLYSGYFTDCQLPKPWWIVRSPKFDVIPEDRAIARNAIFYLKGIPIFYTPFFYKSLKKQPRNSGFLTPNIGNSSRRGFMAGIAYYWAINRSYDLLYRVQLFSARGFAHTADFRGILKPGTDFNLYAYGVQDRGTTINGALVKAPGFLVQFRGRSYIGKGWQARGEVNYLSSFLFRQEFTESFNEAIFSQTRSIGFLTKHWLNYGFTLSAERDENFQSTVEDDKIVIRKLPEAAFNVRERQLKDLPIWFSFDGVAGLVRRTQPLFQTRQFVERLDAAPRVTTAVRFAHVQLIPSFGLRLSHWGSSQSPDSVQVTGDNVQRFARDASVDLILPSLAKVFDAPKWLGGKMKHVIEPRATYRYVNGVDDFRKIIRFDEIELLSNTNEVEVSLANRFYVKDANGNVSELASWEVWYRRFFDPTFGGAVVPGRRNVISSSADLTGFAFFDQPRRDSPIVNAFRFHGGPASVEWRFDYDAFRTRFVNSALTVDVRKDKWFVSAGSNQARSAPVLGPNTNQLRGLIGYGNDNNRGWNGAFSVFYDYRVGEVQFFLGQVTYNTDCCGFSFQYRRFNFGFRNENQFRLSFVVANVGSFGTLRRQERLF